MPNRFDFEEVEGLDGLDAGDEAPGVQQTAASAVVETLYGSESPQDDSSEIDSQMQAVEERLAVAQCYRLLLDDSLFNDASDAARRVEKEVRKFVRQRLEVLMGVRKEVERQKAEEIFTEPEIRILKQIAKVAEDRAKGAVAQAPAPAPSLKRVERQESASQPVQPELNKPKAKQPMQLRKPGTPPPRPANARPASKVEDSRVPAQYKNDPTLMFKDGKAFVQARNADNQPLWMYDAAQKRREPLLKDVTLPARPAPGSPQPIAAPSMAGGQFDMVMQQHGSGMLNTAEAGANKMGIGSLFANSVVSNIGAPTGDQGEEER